MTPTELTSQLRWRYATKAFDPQRTIDPPTWSALEQALVLTPSSFGLQPWHFLVLQDRALRESLVPHAWGQRQVADASHFVVFCARTQVGEADIDRLIRRTVQVRGGSAEALAGYRKMMVGSIVEGGFRPIIREWAIRQVYIALGNFMTAAAAVGVDTCPMEGFDPAKFDEILGLPARGLTAAVCCAAGYRAASDRYAGLAKVRFPTDEVVEYR